MSEQAKKNRRVHLGVTKATLDAIDDYRFTTRALSRSEAARQLIKIGQSVEPSKRQSP